MKFSIMPLLVLLAAAPTLHGATTYNLTSDFSASSNPNGVWSYNLNGIPIATSFVAGAFSGWDPSGGLLDGAVLKTSDGLPTWNDVQAGDILMHSWSNPGSNSSAWTSPGAGVINVSGLVWDGDHFDERDSVWRLTLNGTTLAERGTVFATVRTDPEADFSNNLVSGPGLTGLAVSPGDVLALSTDKTASSPFGHFLGVDMTVEFTPSVSGIPEPTSVLGLAGVIGLALGSRRRRSLAW